LSIGRAGSASAIQRGCDPFSRDGFSLVLAGSARPDEVDRYIELLDARELVDAWTTAADVELAVLTGGFSEAELRDAGAAEVVEEVAAIRESSLLSAERAP
jgi:hypothetical protein